MWLMLFVLTALIVLLPMLPALIEWRRPTDLKALYIDTRDSLDPPFLARVFSARLGEAVAAGQTKLDGVDIVRAAAGHDWRLTEAERRTQASRRIWHGDGDLDLPVALAFEAEVVAQGALRSAPAGAYRALWAGQTLRLGQRSTVTHWAHGANVEVARGCRLEGRVSAETCVTVLAQISFRLLHARTVRFSSSAAPSTGPTAALDAGHPGLPAAVKWDASAARGTAAQALSVADLSAWRGDLICQDDLWLGTGCNAQGSLKARGAIGVNARCRVSGSIVAEGSIALGDGCTVGGSVLSETAVVLSAGCTIGSVERPATVSAPRIEVGPGVTVHGTLWATEQGSATGDTMPPVLAPPRFRPLPTVRSDGRPA